MVKNLPAMQETRTQSLVLGRFPWRREWLPAPVFLPGTLHGQRSLTGYSPWGHKESDTTEHTHTPKGVDSGCKCPAIKVHNIPKQVFSFLQNSDY